MSKQGSGRTSLSKAVRDAKDSFKSMKRNISLIYEIKKRPALYDTSADGYGDLSLKIVLIDEVCEAIFPNWNEFSDIEKFERRDSVTRRWKSLRDCYKRSILWQSRGLKRRKWLFFDYLTFLDSHLRQAPGFNPLSRKTKETSQDNECPDEHENFNFEELEAAEPNPLDEEEQEEQEDIKPVIKPITNTNKRKVESISYNDEECASKVTKTESQFTRIIPQITPMEMESLSSSTDTNHRDCDQKIRNLVDSFISLREKLLTGKPESLDDDDGDKAFLMSLLPTLKTLKLNKKLAVRTKILEVLQDAYNNREHAD